MKKIKPWTGQKAWEEKQAKIAAETDGKSTTGTLYGLDPAKAYGDEITTNDVYRYIYGQLNIKPKNKLADQFPPTGLYGAPVVGSGIGGSPLSGRKSFTITNNRPNTIGINPATVGDPMDVYIFDGGEDGDRDKDLRLPQGISPYLYGDWVNGSDKAEQKPVCCREEDKVNIGFMQDKFACKICGKDM